MITITVGDHMTIFLMVEYGTSGQYDQDMRNVYVCVYVYIYIYIYIYSRARIHKDSKNPLRELLI